MKSSPRKNIAPRFGRGATNFTEDTNEDRSDQPGRTVTAPPSIVAVAAAHKPYRVVIWGERQREWSRYRTFIEADTQARALRKLGIDAHVVGPEAAR